jgi:hypothetical protein
MFRLFGGEGEEERRTFNDTNPGIRAASGISLQLAAHLP